MVSTEVLEEILDMNLAYLRLAQRLVHQDTHKAMVQLGVSKEVADVLGNMSDLQLARLASCK